MSKFAIPVVVTSVLLASIVLTGTAVHANFDLRKTLDSVTTDANGNNHLESDTVRGLFRYNSRTEPWRNPAKYNFTGWGADGHKYVGGRTSQMQGQLSYEGNILPSLDLNTQQWIYGGAAPESSYGVITNSDILEMKYSANSEGQFFIPSYSFAVPTLGASDDFVVRTRFQAENVVGRLSGIVVSNGTKMFRAQFQNPAAGGLLFELDAPGFSPTSDISFADTTVDTYTASSSGGWHTFEMNRSGATITVLLDNHPIMQGAVSSFPDAAATAGVYFGGISPFTVGPGSVPLTNFVDFDFVRFQEDSSVFTTIPEAPWHAEALSATRGATDEFPELAMITTDDLGVSILNLLDNDQELWMRFNLGSANALGTTDGIPGKAKMLDGKLVVAKTNDSGDATNSDGFYMVDFTTGYTYRLTSTDSSKGDDDITARNGGGFVFTSQGAGIGSNSVDRVEITRFTTGEEYIALQESNTTADVIPAATMIPQTRYTYSGFHASGGYVSMALAEDQTLYFGIRDIDPVISANRFAGLDAFYSITADSGTPAYAASRDYRFSTTPFPFDLFNQYMEPRNMRLVNLGSIFANSNLIYFTYPLIGIEIGVYSENRGTPASGVLDNYGHVGGSTVNPILAGTTVLFNEVLPLSNTSAFVVNDAISLFSRVNNTLLDSKLSTDLLTFSVLPSFLEIGATFQEIFTGGTNGIEIFYSNPDITITPTSTTPSAAAQYPITIIPTHPVPSGSRLEVTFAGGFGGFSGLTNADVSVEGSSKDSAGATITATTSTTETINATLQKVSSVMTTSTDITKSIVMTIGDGTGGGLNDLTNPALAGIYQVSYAIFNPSGELVDSGLSRVALGVTAGSTVGSFQIPVDADVQEAVVVTFDALTKNVSADPLVNNGKNVSAYSEVTVSTNAPGGYGLYARLDDGNGVNQLLSLDGNLIASGIGENNFGFEAKNAAYDNGETVVADTSFAASNTLVESNSTTIGLGTATNSQAHTFYYQVDVDFSKPTGTYSGTIYFSVVGTF